ncbi:hypothetical protein GC176_09000 [bacterium]|nr:hypothetical protein [bacterium]
MFFANPWGLLGLLALPAIVVLHLFHRRFPPRLIGGLHLWGVEQRIPIEGRRRERLPITPSLLLELLAALLLTLLLSQPRFSNPEGVAHFIVVLDNSASMAAVGGDGISSRERAIAELAQRLEASPDGSRVTLIVTGRRPTLLAGPAVEWPEANTALADWQPELPGHSPQSALDLAVQLAEDGGQVLFLTDRLPGDADTDSDIGATAAIPESVEVVATGLPLANLAITSAYWSIDPATLRGTVFLRVKNLGPRPQTVTVRGLVDGKPVFESPLSLNAGAESALQTDVPGGAGELTIVLLGTDDGLAVDSRVTLIEPRLRTVKVDIRLPADDARRESVFRVLSQIPAVSLSQTNADLVIAPAGKRLDLRRDEWLLALGPFPDTQAGPTTSAEANVSSEVSNSALVADASTGDKLATATPQSTAEASPVTVSGPYLLDKRHPLLEGVQLGGVVWGGVRPLDAGYSPVISCGSLPLLIQLTGSATTAYALNIDLARSNLTESPDWPILISNLITLRQQALPGLSRWNFRINEDVRFRIASSVLSPSPNDATDETEPAASLQEPVELTLTHGKTSRPISTLGLIELPAIEHAGIYILTRGNQLIERFAVNFFDGVESNLIARQSGTRPPASTEPPSLLEIDTSTGWLILIALLILLGLILADWRVLRRDSAAVTQTSSPRLIHRRAPSTGGGQTPSNV